MRDSNLCNADDPNVLGIAAHTGYSAYAEPSSVQHARNPALSVNSSVSDKP
jgi:hypothetical protein